jgi:hypothetical protein
MNNNFLSNIFENNLADISFTNEEKKRLNNDFWSLLEIRVKRYTMGESSSIPVEKAQDIYESICFCIGVYLKSSENYNEATKQLKETDIQSLFEKGQLEVKRKMAIGQKLYSMAISSKINIQNDSYNDTLKEIKTFFQKYDYNFMAHEIPCSIDYQLCIPIEDTYKGIEYINEYLRRIIIENEFCNRFDEKNIISLLKVYCPNYIEQLINIYDPILTNAIGRAIVGGNITNLNITALDRIKIETYFFDWTEEEATLQLIKAVNKICHRMAIKNIASKEYMLNSVKELYARIKSVICIGNLENIFISFANGNKSNN